MFTLQTLCCWSQSGPHSDYHHCTCRTRTSRSGGNLYSKLPAAEVSVSANEETHPELLQVHHQTVVRKTGGKPAGEDRRCCNWCTVGDGDGKTGTFRSRTNDLTRQPSGRWRCASSLWSSRGCTLSAWTDKNRSPFSCGSVKPASHGTRVSL